MKKAFLMVMALVLFAGVAFADNVTFKIDMNYLSDVGLFDAATEGVALRGSMTNWHDSPENLTEWTLTDDDADLIYEGTFDVGADSPINYKYVTFTTGQTASVNWESDPNRQLALTGTDQVLEPVEWEILVKFQVDMTRHATFDAAVNGVAVMGTFNGWNTGAQSIFDWTLTDDNADKVYTGTFSGIEPAAMEYKFVTTVLADTTLQDWEGISNRIDTLSNVGDVTLEMAYWDSIPPAAEAITANVLFKTDVTALLELGAFDPTKGDTLQIRGNFNGWSDSDAEKSIMRQSLGSLTQYELTVAVTEEIGNDLEYKFFINYDTTGGREVPESGWEEPAGTGGANRKYTFTGDAQQQVPLQLFNDIFAEDVIPEGDTVTVHMTALMKDALADPNVGLLAGGPLQMDAQDPIWRFIAGFPDVNNIDTALVYMDDDVDSTYTLTFDLIGPAPNWIQYKLQWAGVDEEGGDTHTGGRRRVRYIRQNNDGTWPREFTMGRDVWNSTPLTALTVETRDGETINDDDPSSVEQVDSHIPTGFALKQNYPNPFNPSTTIEYKVAKASHVSVFIYNQLGQVVAELVNGFQPAGSYKIHWNLQEAAYQNLASGIYICRMEAGSFVKTNRLILLK